jgi:hypothetical protein
MAIKLTDADKQLLSQLSVQDIKGAAKALHQTPGSLEVRLWRIRRKYKQAVAVKTEIDTLRLRNPNLKKYLKTKEA